MTHIAFAGVALAAALAAQPNTEPRAARAALFDGCLREIVDLDFDAARALYRSAAQSPGAAAVDRAAAIARLLELARMRGDIDAERSWLESLAEGNALLLPLAPLRALLTDPLAGIRQRLAEQTPDQRRTTVAGRLRSARADPRGLGRFLGTRSDERGEDQGSVRELRSQLDAARRAGDEAAAARIERRLADWSLTVPTQHERRLGLQVLHLRLNGHERAASSLLDAALPTAASDRRADAATDEATAARLPERLAAALRSASDLERPILDALAARVDELVQAGETSAAVALVRGAPYYSAVLLRAE
jgi:hypothetical protein